MTKFRNSGPTRLRRWRRVLVGVVLAVAGFGVLAWYKFFRVVPVHFESPEEHFKYGSIGVEQPAGVPYWIWLVLPRIFADKLPGAGGYVALGASWEEGAELPIGFTKVTVGFPRVGLNCAACHTTSVRTTRDGRRSFYLGGPTSRFRPQDYLRFLFNCARDPRFNPDTILREIGYVYRLSWLDKALYRYVLIPQTRRALLETESKDYYWMVGRPDWGPGRTDMNPFKLMVLRLSDDGSIGSTDVMPIWNQARREKLLHHSDGLNPTLTESVRSAALAAAATRKSIDVESLNRVERWLLDLPPPKYPFPVDASRAAAGRKIFERECASCHAFGGPRTGTVVSLEELGTDPNRNRHWTQEAADAFNRFAPEKSWAFHNFRRSDGYVSPPLDAVWIRAPYLHNGSVPTLRDLLEPPPGRPRTFYRGYDVYNPVGVGFVVSGPEAEAEGFRYETEVTGNGNGGHLWGTALSPAEKKVLIEYLKTL